MNANDRAKLRALAMGATPGPWRPCPQKAFIFGPRHEMIASRSRTQDEGEPEKGTVEIRGFGGGLPMDANHDFIVATGPDVVVALLDALEEARRLATVRSPMCQCSDDEACQFVRERDALRTELAAAQAELARLRDDPELDGTDGAHPAWWRGHDARALIERTAEWRDEVMRLRALVPSEEVTTRIWTDNARNRAEVDRIRHVMDGESLAAAEAVFADVEAWLTRVRAARGGSDE